MENFVSDNAKKLWEIFKSTGNVNIYLLYHAVQHTDDKVLDRYIGEEKLMSEGMEL